MGDIHLSQCNFIVNFFVFFKYDKISGKGHPELMDIIYNCIEILIGIL